MVNIQETLFIFKCYIEYDGFIDSRDIISSTSSKARYKFYKEMGTEYSFSDYFKSIKVKKMGLFDVNYIPHISEIELNRFNHVIKSRGLEFITIGMNVSVNGKIGKVLGGNESMNLDVGFCGDGSRINCHPTWKTIYYNNKMEIIKTFN